MTTPAAGAGLQASDIILEFQGAAINNAQDLIQRVASTPVGQQVTLTYLRDVNGKLDKRTATVTLAERPLRRNQEWVAPPKDMVKDDNPRGNALRLGITLAELTPQLVADRHLTGVQGLFVRDVDPNGLMAEIRIPPTGAPALVEGDVINRINRTPVTSLGDFQRVLSGLKAGDPIVLNVTRVSLETRQQIPLIVQFTYQ